MSEWIADWLSYRPGDFLMFAPRTYWRLFELHNEAWWPLQVPAVLCAVAGSVALLRGRRPLPPGLSRAGLLVLAAALGFVAWTFVQTLYAPVNWAADGLAAALAVLALAMVASAMATVRAGTAHSAPPTFVRRGAAVLMLAAAVAWPAAAPMAGRAWQTVEIVGLAPDPTLAAVLAWLLVARPAVAAHVVAHASWLAAWGLALACLAFSAATLATMGSRQWLLPATAIVAAAWLWCRARRAAAAAPAGHMPA
ncbi:MAG: hypothetical protein JNL30_07320 [Rubrivivax sp.]|nr:hypothetical protein [Rubrivivax sp.]